MSHGVVHNNISVPATIKTLKFSSSAFLSVKCSCYIDAPCSITQVKEIKEVDYMKEILLSLIEFWISQ